MTKGDVIAMLSAISHELRSPLSTILLWEYLLRTRGHEPELRQRATDAIRACATMHSMRIAELAELSAVVGGKVKLERDHVATAPIIEAAIEKHQPAADAKRIAIRRHLPRSLGRIHADAARLRDAFGRVIETAVRVSPNEAAVVIAARRAKRTVAITIGQSHRIVPRCEPVAATELGMLIARELVALHGGQFQVMRPERGGIPTVRIGLPVLPRRVSRAS